MGAIDGEEHIADPVQRRARAFQFLDRVGEGRWIRVFDDGRNLGLLFRHSGAKRRHVMLVFDLVEGGHAVRRIPLFQ